MNICRSTLFSLLLISVPAAAQEESADALLSHDHYTLKISVDEERHLLQGEAQVGLTVLRDSLAQVHLTLAASAELLSVRDSLDRKIEFKKQDGSVEGNRKEIFVVVPDTVKRGGRLFLKIAYEMVFDTVSTLPSFINEREILLTTIEGEVWYPHISSPPNFVSCQNVPGSIEATLSSGFVVAPGPSAESVHVEGAKVRWKFVNDLPANRRAGFVLCASKDFVKTDIAGEDSSFHVSLYCDPVRFNQDLAELVLRQLKEAYSFFASLTGFHSPNAHISFALIGQDNGRINWQSGENIVIGRNSFAYRLLDSTLLSSNRKNKWVHELAHFFGIASTDSTYLFDEGWVNFLTAKFFIARTAKDEDAQRQVRLGIFSTTLDFYPSQTLAQGRGTGKNEEAVFFNRGSCVFLMLDYFLGEETFRALTRLLYEKYKDRPVTITEFQQLCEAEYGSSLDWFFKQWVFQAGIPELILSSEVTQTNRGNYLVKAVISQRGDLFTMPADLVFSGNGRTVTKRVFVERQDQEFEFILPFLPVRSELDPNYFVLRWVPRLRLLAHARTAVSFRVFDHDLANSEREAMLTLQLDPNNLTGWNNIALFALGKSSVIKGEMAKAEEYFRRASALEANEPTQLYSVLSLVRLGNVLEMQGKRDEALEMYKLSVTLAQRNPALYNVALYEALKYIREQFNSSDEFWYGEY